VSGRTSISLIDETDQADRFTADTSQNRGRQYTTIQEKIIMKTKSTLTRSILALALAGALLFALSPLKAENEHQHQHGDHDGTTDKVRCAVDGMMMKPSGMTKLTHDGKTHYFCNAKQAEMFKANPKRFLKTVSLGHLTFNLNLLTIDEYKAIMNDMGMAGMMKMDEIKGKTHQIGLYTTQHGRELPLDEVKIAVEITDADGKGKMALLEYNKMMKSYEGFIGMPKGGEYQLRVRVTSPSVNVSM
jgi:YHS domain-containing protein